MQKRTVTIMSGTHAQLLARISVRLHELFDGLINLQDVAAKGQKEREGYFLTRSLAALSLLNEVDLKPDEAAASVTDGSVDDGIDAIYVDEKKKVIYLVQSKWKSGGGGVQLTDFTKFRDGVKNVISLNWSSDNSGLHKFCNKIETALQDIDTTIVMLFVHTSEQHIARNIQSRITAFLLEQNKFLSDFVEFKELGLSSVAHIARSLTRPSDINLSVMIKHWGSLSSPYKAFYGSVAAIDVAKWYEDYGNKLFVENLRYLIDKSDVNEAIIETASQEPEKFWYFNNGITAVCDSVSKQPIGGSSTDSGAFDIKKISVINGAQTIGSLARAKAAKANLDDALVHFRIISLTDTPEGFAAAVTRSNNTQNDLNPIDFVSLDSNQDRIRKEAAQIGLVYSYRRGDVEPPKASGFNIRSATIAAACASGDLRLAVASKRYISGLWSDVTREPYTKIFNEQVSAAYLWNIVQIMNAVDERLSERAEALSGRDRLMAIHGNRFILFYVFQNIVLKDLRTQGAVLDPVKAECVKLAEKCLNQVRSKINDLFPDSYPGNIFKNQDRQTQLLGAIQTD